jgi:hypothetical protein
MLEYAGPVLVQVLNEADAVAASDQTGQFRLALLERSVTQVLALELQQVEGLQEHGAVVATAVQQVEVRHPVRSAADRLAVDRGGLGRQTRQSLPDPRKAIRPVRVKRRIRGPLRRATRR